MQILIVEDDKKLALALKQILMEADYQVDAVHDGLTGGTQQTMAYAMRRGIEIMDTPSVLEKKPCGV